jgi:L-lactate dehydrogenase complex protein LldE
VSTPAGPRRVTLFVTCIVDQLYPDIGKATVHILERLGVAIHVPRGLTCCGQMAFNAGFRDESYAVAGRTIELLRGQGDVVLPSGSCAAMIRHLYAELFAHSPYAGPAAELAARTYELTEYLVDVLGVTDLGALSPTVGPVAGSGGCSPSSSTPYPRPCSSEKCTTFRQPAPIWS